MKDVFGHEFLKREPTRPYLKVPKPTFCRVPYNMYCGEEQTDKKRGVSWLEIKQKVQNDDRNNDSDKTIITVIIELIIIVTRNYNKS